MRAARVKQTLKNGVYRALGETASGVGALDGDQQRTLRVLMYHEINDVPENSARVPVGLFDEQMAQLGELGYQPVTLDAVLDHYLAGTPLPTGAQKRSTSQRAMRAVRGRTRRLAACSK